MVDGTDADETRPSDARWGFWATTLWAVVVALISVAVQLVTLLASADWPQASLADLSFEQLLSSGSSKWYSLPLSAFLAAIVSCGAIAAIIKLKKHAALREYLCLKPVAFVTMLKWIGLLMAFTVVAAAISAWLDERDGYDFISAIYASAHPVWTLWLVLIVAVPISEEIFFRGFLFAGFASSFLRPAGATVVTAGLWAAAHVQYDAFGIGIVFCIGLLFGAARIVTGSLTVPLALHALMNLQALVGAALSQ